MEFNLLQLLSGEPGRVYTRDEILSELRGIEPNIFSRSVDINISRLRQKLDDDPSNPRFIRTIRGAGYVFPEGAERNMNNPIVRTFKWLSRKPVEAWRSLPVRLILIFVASLFVMVAGVFVLTIVVPPRQNMTEFRIYGYSMIAVVIGGCYLAVRRLFYPLQDIRLGARRIREGQLDYRIPIRRQDELGRLSQRINRMAGEVQRMLDGQRQLLLSLSHELRTPLTRARLALEFIHDREVRSHLEYDLSSMERMITELLEGERLNTRSRRMSRSRVNLNKLMAEVMRGDFPNDRHRVSLSVPPAAAHLSVNAARLRMLVRNLVENALALQPPGRGAG